MAYFSYFLTAVIGIVVLGIILFLCNALLEKKGRKFPFLNEFGYAFLCIATCVMFIILIGRSENKLPVVVETISEPQVDTTVVLFSDGTSDTTYTYTFPNIVVE